MRLIASITAFLIINFSALALGTLLMNNGPSTTWYLYLNKAPWTPPGWVFGFAWTFIMICFSIYMAFLYKVKIENKIAILFIIQFILNVSWNYIFFNQHLIGMGLLVIVLLTIVIATFLLVFKNNMKLKSLLLAPYFVWLCIATSLNAYILLNN